MLTPRLSLVPLAPCDPIAPTAPESVPALWTEAPVTTPTPAPEGVPALAATKVAKAAAQRVRQDEQKALLVLASTYVFEYWRETYGKPRAKLDQARLRVILRAVADCEGHLSDLLFALDGARKDDWIMGRARGSTSKYDTPETILRDRASVERHADRMGGWGRNESHPAIGDLPPDLTRAATWT